MKKSDLKVGMVVKSREGNLYMVMPTEKEDLIIVRIEAFSFLYNFNDDLSSRWDKKFDIVEVYGLPDVYRNATTISIVNRKLLWERKEEKKKMTVAEIEDILGYKIEVVSES